MLEHYLAQKTHSKWETEAVCAFDWGRRLEGAWLSGWKAINSTKRLSENRYSLQRSPSSGGLAAAEEHSNRTSLDHHRFTLASNSEVN